MLVVITASEMFVRRMVEVVRLGRVLVGYHQTGDVVVGHLANDRCPVPVELPLGRVNAPESALCSADVKLVLRLEDPDATFLFEVDLGIFEDDTTRAMLVVWRGCDHRDLLRSLVAAAIDRVFASEGAA